MAKKMAAMPFEGTPIAHRITTDQGSGDRRRPAGRRHTRQIEVWSSTGKVVVLQVVASAFGAGATLRVNGYMANGKQVAQEIEMGPFPPP